MSTEKIAGKPWSYTLYRLENGTLVLSVLCGGAGIYELNILLEPEVANKAMSDPALLEVYAGDIRSHPDKYAHRSVDL